MQHYARMHGTLPVGWHVIQVGHIQMARLFRFGSNALDVALSVCILEEKCLTKQTHRLLN